MAIAGSLIDGDTNFGGEPPGILRTATGWTGRKMFLVNTLSEYLAVTAPGVPQLGQAYAQELPDLKVVSQATRRVGGLPRGDGSQEGGNTLVTCEYATPGAGGRLPVPEVGKAWTEIATATSSYQLMHDQRLVNPDLEYVVPPNEPTVASTGAINSGRGVAVPTGTLRARVVMYYDAIEPNWGLISRLAMRQGVNRFQLKLPAVNQGTFDWVLEPGQVQYVGATPDLDRGVKRVIHELNVAEDFLYRWMPENAQGEPAQDEPVPTVLFPAFAFAGLWPGAV